MGPLVGKYDFDSGVLLEDRDVAIEAEAAANSSRKALASNQSNHGRDSEKLDPYFYSRCSQAVSPPKDVSNSIISLFSRLV